MIYYASLAMLFAGLVLVYGLGVALIVVGGVGVLVSIATAFYLTSLTARMQGK